MTFTKILIVLSFVLIIIYTSVVLYIFATTGVEPVTLTQYFFGALIGEFSLMGGIKGIKVLRLRRESKKEVQCNDEDDPHANAELRV